MDHPASDPTHRANSVAHRVGHRMNASAVRRVSRGACRLLTRLVVNVTIWVAGGIVLVPASTRAQTAPAPQTADSAGPIVIPGPGEKNPAALADLAEHMQTTPARRVGSAASLNAATAQSLSSGPSARDADPFARAANASGSIVIPGAGEAPAAPTMIRTSFKPDANGVVTIPAPTRQTAMQAAVANGIASSPDTAAGFDTLASRGEPPQLGANGKPIASRLAVATSAAATQPAPMPAPATIARVPVTRPVAPAIAQQNLRAAAVPQAAPLPGQQDAETIRSAALAFLQQQSAGLPGKVEITVAPAFPRGLSACTVLEPFMPSGARLWGRMTVGVRCAGERPWTIYLQARISLHATYYLAARAMAPGEVLSAADLVARDGDLTGLPQAIVTDPSQAVGSVSLVRVAGGMPLRRDMLKSASAVSIGQTVHVVAAGQGFAISAEGSAMNNASPGQQVRVKTANGQIISGIVKDGSTVEIQL
ncbi:MAG TPA: flagellar basal body P-ring formation chaperone FlgA [Paraburkholderia sp.]|jgi:flagella basal body P-ring formation protein FlgA|nr:flagellar basal body P-ring formation chaperone FlgA [Paraburkholderia sp.]